MKKEFVLEKNFPLVNKTTFAVDCLAKNYVCCKNGKDIFDILKQNNFLDHPKFFLGNGSNVLFTKDYEGVIIQTFHKEISVKKKDLKNIWVKASSAVDWDSFVDYCVENSFYGIENLALIPGTVGASVVQNIGAYGVEIGSLVQEVEVINLKNGKISTLLQSDCNFSYRNSIFKENKNFVVFSVTYKLSLNGELNFSYTGIKEYLIAQEVLNPTIKDVRNAVCEVRKSKLPDYTKFPNAGSFFKNPIIPNFDMINLKLQYPDMPVFAYDEENKKISAAWLIEKAGWKGKGNTSAKVSDKHSLVLTKLPDGTGKDILDLANYIVRDVKSKFGIVLEPEVEIL